MGLRKSRKNPEEGSEESLDAPWHRGLLAGDEEGDSPETGEVEDAGALAEEPEGDEDLGSDAEGDADDGLADDTAVPQALESFFQAHLDEEGRLPQGIDQFFADVGSVDENEAREVSYMVDPRERTPDYVPQIQRLAPVKPPEGEELGVGEQLENAAKIMANKGINALNKLAGTDMEKFSIPRSAEESFLTNILHAEGLTLAGVGVTTVGGATLAMAGLAVPAMVTAAVGGGLYGLNVLLNSFDEPERMQLYEPIVTGLFEETGHDLGGGVIPDDMGRRSQMERVVRMIIAEGLDVITGGAVMKAGKTGFRALRGPAAKMNAAIGEEGFLNAKVLSRKGRIEASDLHEATPEEFITKGYKDDAEMRKFLAERLSLETTQDALQNLRISRQHMKDDPELMERLSANIANLEYETRELLQLDKGWEKSSVPLGASLSAGASYRKGKSLASLQTYVRDSHLEFGALKDLPKKEAALGEAVLPETLERLKDRRSFARQLMANAIDEADTSFEDKLLRQSKKYAEIHSILDLHKNGVRSAKHRNMEMMFGIMGDWERSIEKLGVKRMKGTFTKDDAAVLKNLSESWEKAYKGLLDPKGKEGLGEMLTTLGLNSWYDNILGKRAAHLAIASGLSGLGAKLIFRTGWMPYVKGTLSKVWGHPAYVVRYPSIYKRAWNSLYRRGKDFYFTKPDKWTDHEIIKIWQGRKDPRRFSKFQLDRTYVGDSKLRLGANMMTGTSKVLLSAGDDFVGALSDSFAQVEAMEKILKGYTHNPVTLKGFLDDIENLSPDAFYKKHPDFTTRYLNEVNQITDEILFRADPGDVKDMGAFGRLGRKMYNMAVKNGHRNPNQAIAAGAQAAMPFPRVWANTLMWADRLTPIGLIGNERGFKAALKSDERQFGTAVIALGSFFFHSTDFLNVIDGSSREKDLRKFGGRSGIQVGDISVEWDELGPYGTAYRHLFKAAEVMRITPVTGDILEGLGADAVPGSEGNPLQRVATAFTKALQYGTDDSFFQQGLATLTFASMGSGKALGRPFGDFWREAVNPGQSIIKRIKGITGDETQYAHGSNVPFMNAIKELGLALEPFDFDNPRRDDLGVPWTRGEYSEEETGAWADLYGWSMYVANPIRRGRTPKSVRFRRWLLENGATGGDSVVAGNQVISKKAFKDAFGMDPPVFNGSDRRFTANGTGYELDPRSQNDRVTLLSMDWEAADKVLAAYELYWDSKESVPGQEDLDSYWRRKIVHNREQLKWDVLAPYIRQYYPKATEKTRMIDILSFLATAPLREFEPEMRAYIAERADAFVEHANEHRKYKRSLRNISDGNIRKMAENIVRMHWVRKYYDWMDRFAGRVMEASPTADEQRNEGV